MVKKLREKRAKLIVLEVHIVDAVTGVDHLAFESRLRVCHTCGLTWVGMMTMAAISSVMAAKLSNREIWLASMTRFDLKAGVQVNEVVISHKKVTCCAQGCLWSWLP